LAEDIARHVGGDIAIVGELRRGLEVIDAIDLVTTSPDARGRFEKFRKLAAGHTAEGVPVRLHVVAPGDLGVASVRLTGSDAHVVALGELRGATEEEVYANAGLQWVPPPMREGEDEIALARAHDIPKLVQETDIRGMVHCHTD